MGDTDMEKTERLYYDDCYLREFDACVVAVKDDAVALDCSAFYPTSGGQPFDTGVIVWEGGEAAVTDTQVKDDVVWHTVSTVPPMGTRVHGRIDWDRRFEHMQQHAADHMIAGAAWQQFGGVTIGLHTGQDTSSIDMTLPDGRTHITREELIRLEETVNARIQHADAIRCWFPDESELETLPLRKKPTVSEHVRIVAMGDYEMVACGGTHPRTTGEIGLVHIISCTPSRGNMRVTFVAGMRAVRYLRKNADCASALCKALSGDVDTAPGLLAQERENNQNTIRSCRTMLTAAAVEKIMASAQSREGYTLYHAFVPFADRDILLKATMEIIAAPDAAVLLSCPQENGCSLVFARGSKADIDMSKLIRACGGRGGGKPDMAQGAAPDDTALEKAAALI